MPPEFLFSFVVLTFLRFARKATWLILASSALLSALSLWFTFTHQHWIVPYGLEPRCLYTWLSAAAWITTAWGSREPVWTVFLLPYFFNSAGLTGIFTGIALNLPLPQRKPRPETEHYGIYRHAR